MPDAAERDENETVSGRVDRRTFLKGAGGASVAGGALALSAAAGADPANDNATDPADDSDEATDEPESTAAAQTDDFDESASDLQSLECGKPLQDELTEDSASTREPGDRHNRYYNVYSFEGTARERISINVYTEVTRPADPDEFDSEPEYAGYPAALLLDPDGMIIAEGEETGYFGMDFFNATLPSDGEYHLIVTSTHWNRTFEYTLSLGCQDRMPVVDDPPEPVPIQCGETIETDFTEGDPDGPLSRTYDVYPFDGTCGDVVTITAETDEMGVTPQLCDPDGHQDPPEYDSKTGEFDPRGTAVPVDDGTQIPEYELPKTGTYTIWIARSSWYDYQYNLTLECAPKR